MLSSLRRIVALLSAPSLLSLMMGVPPMTSTIELPILGLSNGVPAAILSDIVVTYKHKAKDSKPIRAPLELNVAEDRNLTILLETLTAPPIDLNACDLRRNIAKKMTRASIANQKLKNTIVPSKNSAAASVSWYRLLLYYTRSQQPAVVYLGEHWLYIAGMGHVFITISYDLYTKLFRRTVFEVCVCPYTVYR
jgi:hypothetical protein